MKNNGGPAFPAQEYSADISNGMTLRDYFAAKAMHGLASLSAHPQCPSVVGQAQLAYEIADAMLAERDRQ